MAMHARVQTMLGGLAGNDTPERRQRVLRDAHTRCNILGGRLSQRVAETVFDLNNNIRNEREADELYGERAMREDLERQNSQHWATSN